MGGIVPARRIVYPPGSWRWEDKYSSYFASLADRDLKAEAGNTIDIDGIGVIVGSEIATRCTSLDIVNGTGIVWVHTTNQGQGSLRWLFNGLFDPADVETIYRLEVLTQLPAILVGNNHGAPSLWPSDTAAQNYAGVENQRWASADTVRAFHARAGVYNDTEIPSSVLNVTDPVRYEFIMKGHDMVVNYEADCEVFKDHGAAGSLLGVFGFDEKVTAIGGGAAIFDPDLWNLRMSAATAFGPETTVHYKGLRIQQLVEV